MNKSMDNRTPGTAYPEDYASLLQENPNWLQKTKHLASVARRLKQLKGPPPV
jgi:hypothetical protein